jgi:hypothetical protein
LRQRLQFGVGVDGGDVLLSEIDRLTRDSDAFGNTFFRVGFPRATAVWVFANRWQKPRLTAKHLCGSLNERNEISIQFRLCQVLAVQVLRQLDLAPLGFRQIGPAADFNRRQSEVLGGRC